MSSFEKFATTISKMDLLEHARIFDNQLPRLYDLALRGAARIVLTVHSTGEVEPATGAAVAIPDATDRRFLMAPLNRWLHYGPGEGDGVFAGHFVAAGGIQIQVDNGQFNITFPVQQEVQGLVMQRTIAGTGPDGTEYVVSLSTVDNNLGG